MEKTENNLLSCAIKKKDAKVSKLTEAKNDFKIMAMLTHKLFFLIHIRFIPHLFQFEFDIDCTESSFIFEFSVFITWEDSRMPISDCKIYARFTSIVSKNPRLTLMTAKYG